MDTVFGTVFLATVETFGFRICKLPRTYEFLKIYCSGGRRSIKKKNKKKTGGGGDGGGG